MSRAVVLAPLLAVALCGGACSTTFEDTVGGIVGDVQSLFGASSPPARYLAEIGQVHDGNTWAFKPGVDSPLERTCTAVRELGTCGYATWGEVAYTTQILARMVDEHPSLLVRAECLDTLTKLAPRTFAAVVPPEKVPTREEWIDALLVPKEAAGRTDADAEFTAKVADAVDLLAAYPYDAVDPESPNRADRRTFAREYGERLRNARAVLGAVNGRDLQGLEADPSVREALQRAYVAVSGAVTRLTLLTTALRDPSETTRATAVHDVGVLAFAGGTPVLRVVLIQDGIASVRREAAGALAAYPRDTVVPALIDGLSDEMADVRGAAARSLESVTGETFGDDRTAWIRWWQANGAPKAAPGASR